MDPNYHRRRRNKWRGEGRAAYYNGEGVDANPYQGSWAANNWRLGYDDAKEEARKILEAQGQLSRG
jgi:hypothetical protein